MRSLLSLALTMGGLTVATTMASPAPASAVDDPVHTVGVTGTDVGMFPAFDPEVGRYAVTTTDATGGSVTVTATTTDPAGQVRINGVPDADGVRTLTGLEQGDEIAVFIEDSAGIARHSLVYLPADFPTLERVTPDPAPGALAPGHVLLTMGYFIADSAFYEAAVDLNGVPAYVRSTFRSTDLQRQPNGNYSIFRLTTEPGRQGWDLVEMNDRFEEVARHRTVDLVHTDGHDAIVQPDGTVWLMSYEDRSPGGPIDAVLQRIDPDGTLGFEWTSEPYEDESLIPADDPVYGTDYAHVNSFQVMADGDLLVSFRSLSSVYKIATSAHDGFLPGDVVWKLGGRDSTFTFPVGDGGPCAQHTARELPDGNILMYDNGSWNGSLNLCVDPDDPSGPATQRAQTRVVEFELDETANTATPVWTYAPAGRFAVFAGSAQRMANGNTVVGWAEETQALASEVDAAGNLLWEIRDPSADPRFMTYRAHKTVVPDAFAPEVEITTPAQGASYVEGEVVTAAYECTDRGGSSLQTCVGSVDHGRPLDTSTPGTHTYTVAATDGSGETRTVSRSYVVRPAAQPDAAVRTTGKPFRGVGTYGRAADQQVRAAVRRPGGRAKVVVRITNDGAVADRLTFRVVGSSPAWRVTGRFADGGTTPLLGPGETWTFRLAVTRRLSTPPGERIVVRVPTRSMADPGRRDAVSAEVRSTR